MVHRRARPEVRGHVRLRREEEVRPRRRRRDRRRCLVVVIHERVVFGEEVRDRRDLVMATTPGTRQTVTTLAVVIGSAIASIESSSLKFVFCPIELPSYTVHVLSNQSTPSRPSILGIRDRRDRAQRVELREELPQIQALLRLVQCPLEARGVRPRSPDLKPVVRRPRARVGTFRHKNNYAFLSLGCVFPLQAQRSPGVSRCSPAGGGGSVQALVPEQEGV